jgi:hypothetical protein
MSEKLNIVSERGKKAVRLHDDGYGLELLTRRNGYQWTGAPVDDDILEMLEEVIDAYKVR